MTEYWCPVVWGKRGNRTLTPTLSQRERESARRCPYEPKG
jgi:hypothetical protein